MVSAQISRSHNLLILDKIKDDRKELWSAVNPEAFLLLKFLLDNSHKV